jgi:plasmid stabilization system protein ParE
MAIRYGPQVERELDDIWIYLAQESGGVEVAERLIASITEHFFLLSRYPQLGRRRDEDLRPGLRSLFVNGYVVIYRIEDHDVLILHVLHGRDIKMLLDL